MKQVLSQRADSDATVGIHEDWSWGPIGDQRLDERIAFMKQEDPVPWDDYWEALPAKYADFWGRIDNWHGDRLIWLGSRSATELAGYLTYLDRYPDRPTVVVRPDDYLPVHPDYGVHGATGALNAEKMADVLDNAERRSTFTDSHLFSRWQELVEEGAMLRVLDGQNLVSAPISAHDHFIIDSLTNEWEWGARVIGHAMGKTFDAQIVVSDAILFSRLARLVEEGIVEADGDLRRWNDDMRPPKTMVRLAS